MNGWMDGWMDGWMVGGGLRVAGCGVLAGWLAGSALLRLREGARTEGCTDGRMKGWREGWVAAH
eukprot:3634830-Rhodomonas_salina.1